MRKPFLLLLGLVASCTVQSGPQLVEGGLYSSPNEDGSFAVVKILKLDEMGVHVRVYSNRFETDPSEVDEGELYIAGVDHESGGHLGMGHLPLSKDSFVSMLPKFIKPVPVEPSELEGYEIWKEGGGGYF